MTRTTARKKRVYLAGPMRGYVECNFPAFIRAAKKLREAGYEVFSPAERDLEMGIDYLHPENLPPLDTFLVHDLPEVCKCDVIAVLPGWEHSQGASIEVEVARRLKKPVLDAESGRYIVRPGTGEMQIAVDAVQPANSPLIRQFSTGATRGDDREKYDYEGFLSPLVIERFGEYMHKHRHLPDGRLRDSDNWQRGMAREVYMKSAWRHFVDWETKHRGWPGSEDGVEDVLCAMMFNAMGYLHETLKERHAKNR